MKTTSSTPAPGTSAFTTTRIGRRGFLALTGALTGSLLLVACGSGGTVGGAGGGGGTPVKGGTLKFALLGSPGTIDPQIDPRRTTGIERFAGRTQRD